MLKHTAFIFHTLYIKESVLIDKQEKRRKKKWLQSWKTNPYM